MTYQLFNQEELRKFCTTVNTSDPRKGLTMLHVVIDSKEMDMLAEALQHNTSVTEITLRDCYWPKKKFTRVVEALQCNTSLTELYLPNNRMVDEEAYAIASMLETNTTLTDLTLWGNEFTSNGLNALVNVLCTNTALQKLDLQFMNLQPVLPNFTRMLRCNSTLQSLDIDKKILKNETQAAEIKEALKYNSTLTWLHSDCTFECLQRNKNNILQRTCTLEKLLLQGPLASREKRQLIDFK